VSDIIYARRFGVSFLAATILSAHSEFGLVGLIAAARGGNTLGELVNLALGRSIDRLHDRKWFPAPTS